jgi:hypothetical protein
LADPSRDDGKLRLGGSSDLEGDWKFVLSPESIKFKSGLACVDPQVIKSTLSSTIKVKLFDNVIFLGNANIFK